MLLLPMASVVVARVQRDTLFIENFGGNNTNDPKIATTHNPYIDNSYTMVTSEANLKCGYENNFAKTYLLTKVGKHASGWHLQMDHTYPGDSTRGYFMLVDDGPVLGDPIYTSKGILVSPGQKLHFGASFANVKTWYGSNGNASLTTPAFRVRLLDMVSGNVLREFQTGQIPYPNPDVYINQAPWRYFEDVYLVPGNITEVQVEVAAETTNNRWGNDYAVDDIVAYVEREVIDLPCERMDTIFYEDFGGNDVNDPQVSWTPVSSIADTYTQVFSNTYLSMVSGGYLVAKRGYHNGPPTFSQWFLMGDHTHYGDTTRGYFLEVDGRGNGAQLYEVVIQNPVVGAEMTFSAYVANVVYWKTRDGLSYIEPVLEFRMKDQHGNVLAKASSGPIPLDTTKTTFQTEGTWHKVGMQFTVPEGVTKCVLQILDNARSGWGNDFALDDIMLLQCASPEKNVVLQGCDSVAYNGEMFYRDTVFTHTIDEQVFHVDITVHHSTYVHETYSGVDSLEFEGTMYYADTTLIIRGTTKDGCDAIRSVTLHIAQTPVYYLDNLIVNEMSWLVVCNNRLLREKYPAEYYVYQWIKNGLPVKSKYPYPDYYTEDERLEGQFELEVTLHNDGQPKAKVRSNIVTILPVHAAPERIAIYNKAGVLVYEAVGNVEMPHLQSGFYVVKTMQDNKIDVRKLIVQ